MQFSLNSWQTEAKHSKDHASALESKLSQELNEANAKSEQTIQSHQDEIKTLNSQLKQSTDHLTSQNQQLTEKNQALEAQFDESKKSNIELQTRITELTQTSGDSLSQLNSLNENLKEKEK